MLWYSQPEEERLEKVEKRFHQNLILLIFLLILVSYENDLNEILFFFDALSNHIIFFRKSTAVLFQTITGKSISISSNFENQGFEGQYGQMIKPFKTLSCSNLIKTLSIRGRGGKR